MANRIDDRISVDREKFNNLLKERGYVLYEDFADEICKSKRALSRYVNNADGGMPINVAKLCAKTLECEIEDFTKQPEPEIPVGSVSTQVIIPENIKCEIPKELTETYEQMQKAFRGMVEVLDEIHVNTDAIKDAIRALDKTISFMSSELIKHLSSISRTNSITANAMQDLYKLAKEQE